MNQQDKPKLRQGLDDVLPRWSRGRFVDFDTQGAYISSLLWNGNSYCVEVLYGQELGVCGKLRGPPPLWIDWSINSGLGG